MSKHALLTAFALVMIVTSLFAQVTTPSYVTHQCTPNRIIIKNSDGYLMLQQWGNEVFRISFSPDSIFESPSDAVSSHQTQGNIQEMNDKQHLFFESGNSTININKKTLSLQISNSTLEHPIVISPAQGFPERGHGFAVDLSTDERITGGGARAIPMDRRNRLLRLNNEPHWGYGFGEENLNYSLPVFVSDNNYLLFFDAPQRAWADIGKTDTSKMMLYSPKADYSCFVVLGENYANLIEKYTELTGRQPLPPRWALGNLQSRFGYQSQNETLAMADTLIKAGYPIDGLIIDLYWFGKGPKDWGMGNLEWDTENWPSPLQMTETLKKQGVRTILITEPFILNTAKKWSEANTKQVLGKDSLGQSFIIKDFYFGPAGLVDVFSPTGNAWFWQQYVRLKSSGIAGWWGDLGEPEKHPSGIHYALGQSDDVHNIYGHYWSKMLADGYAKNYPSERLFFLNRAGYAGSQRYGIFPWSGDVSRSWSGFEAQLPIMLGMAMNGIPYMHSDLGGFAAGEKDDELYRRWLQFGVFNPIFRPHGEKIPSEPIFFNDTTQQIVNEAIKLRYRLMPYNYTLAWEQTTKGWPLARPMMWYNPKDSALFDVYDTYYWGESFLVSPIIKKGQTEKAINLPSGVWYDFRTYQPINGGTTTTVSVDKNSIPVFVKAGSIVPMATDFTSTDFYPTDTLIVRYYAHPSVGNTNYTLFEDDGKNAQSLQNNDYRLVEFCGATTDKNISLSINTKGSYPNSPNKRVIVLETVTTEEPRWVKINNKKLSQRQWMYNNTTKTTTLSFDYNNENTCIIIKSK